MSATQQAIVVRNRWRELLERPGIPQLMLAVVTLLVYARSVGFAFVYDDHILVEHPFPLSWDSIIAAFTNDSSPDHASNFYRPLTIIWQSFMTKLAGASAAGWHLSSILLHVICVVLVFQLASKLLKSRELATYAAAIFALHPTHVEAVTWISDAADPLMTICLLLSAMAFIRWLENDKLAWCIFSFALALTCCFLKEIGVVVPALLLALMFVVEHKKTEPAILLTAAVFFSGAIGFLALRSQVLHGFAHPLSATTTGGSMMLTEPAALWFYFSHLLFPVRLGPCYPLAFISRWNSAAFLLPAFFFLVLIAAGVWAFARTRARGKLAFCFVWILAPLAAPLYLKLFPAFELVHDRYLYIPSIALGIALASAVEYFSQRTSASTFRNLPAVALGVVVLAFAAQTLGYQGTWKNDTTLFERAMQLTPTNDRIIVNLGVNKLQRGQLQEGSALLKRALEIQPENAFALSNLGRVASDTNDLPAAKDYLERALQLEPRPKWMTLLAAVELRLGNFQAAETDAQQALEWNPAERGAHMMLAAARLEQGDAPTAVREFTAELQLYPDQDGARRGLQIAQERLRRAN